MENIFTLLFLIGLQAVLGFDNLLYISLVSKRAEPSERKKVLRNGILMAIGLRIALLYVLILVVDMFQKPFFSFDFGDYACGMFNFHSTIVLFGGAFILYEAIRNVWRLSFEEIKNKGVIQKFTPPMRLILEIVGMNLIFSFDSILGAMALTNVFWIMAVAIVFSGLLMLALANKVTEFLERHKVFEILGLMVLFLVGVMLLTDGGHLAHLEFFGHKIEPLEPATFYFVIFFLVAADFFQMKYQNKLLRKKYTD